MLVVFLKYIYNIFLIYLFGMEKRGLKRMKNSSKSKKAIVYENLKIREILECEVVKRAALKSNPDEVESIKKKFEAESNGDKNSRDHFRAGDRIHTFVFECLGNKRLLEYYKRLQEHIIRMRRQ